jgi:putative effector of murein hydrolase LrgA (UPF0299 family)
MLVNQISGSLMSMLTLSSFVACSMLVNQISGTLSTLTLSSLYIFFIPFGVGEGLVSLNMLLFLMCLT